jgi:ankyrin repeat protein
MPKNSSKKGSKKQTPAPETTLVPHRAPNLTDLLERAKRGKLSDVQQYLSAGGSPNVLVSMQPSWDGLAPVLCGVVDSLRNGGEVASSVRLLLHAGAAVDATFVGADGSMHTALQVASMHKPFGAADCLQALLDGGADPCYQTAKGVSVMHYAAANGNLEGCKKLHAASSGRTLDIEGGLEVLGVTPLLLACSSNQIAAVQLLCELGADVKHRDNEDRTALMYAAAEADAPLVHYLLERVSINVTDNRGDTALIAAAHKGKYASVKLLLERGADAHTLNSTGSGAIYTEQLRRGTCL